MAISEKDLPANWGVKGGPYDEADEKIAWFKSHGVTIEDLISAGAITADEAPWFKTQGLESVGDRVDTLAAEFDHIPKFKIAADINAGLSDEAIRAKYTVAPDVATKLMQQSMTTGTIDPYAFAKLGGYDAVKEVYDANQGSYNLADIPLSQLKSAADRIATTGVGNKAVLDLVKSNTQQQQPQPFKSVTGDTGVKVEGESGLREGYTDYVQDMLQRASGLLARRNVDPVTGEPTYTGPQFGGTGAGGYGTETAQTLKDLQARREAMMGIGEDKSAVFQPYKYSFAPKPAKSGGVMSLVDHYDDGGAVGNAAVTTSGGVGSDTIAGGTQGAQVVPSTYNAPTNIYSGPGDSGITTGSFDPAAISRFTNPYATAVTDPQVREAKRQAELARQSQAAKFSQAGAFGGSRSILAENELGRNLATQIGDIYGKGQKEAYDAALRAFEAEEGRKLTAGVETERARQEAGRQGLTGAANEAQYQQLARDLQQRAEEATARGDQFAANLALQQLAEANRAAEATRQFEYTQARDTYLDPFRELGYASQLLTGLPIKAGDTGTSSLAEAIAGGAGGVSLVNSIINNPTYMADLRKALGLPPG
jgi:hypothetical protein